MTEQDRGIPRARPRAIKDGSGWVVEFTWPDGRLERIGTFALEVTARDWIAHEFEKYFREKLAH